MPQAGHEAGSAGAPDRFEALIRSGHFAAAIELLCARTEAAARAEEMCGAPVTVPAAADCRRFLDGLAGSHPRPLVSIGFDRPATLYIISELTREGGAMPVLAQMIRARPWERHVVLFSAHCANDAADAIARLTLAGGFAMMPDPGQCRLDDFLWLRGKVAALAARRVMFLHRPGDVIATLAAHEAAARFGARTYVPGDADAAIPAAATGLRIAPGAAGPGVEPTARGQRFVLPQPVAIAPHRLALPLPPAPARPGPGRRAALRWRLARLRWRLRGIALRLRGIALRLRGRLGRGWPASMRNRADVVVAALGAKLRGSRHRAGLVAANSGERDRPAMAARLAGPALFARCYNAMIAAVEAPAGEGVTAEAPPDGEAGRRAVAALFDPQWYCAAAGAAAADQPLQHYFSHGAAAGISPHPLFDPGHYLARLPATMRRAALPDPFAHYLCCGEALGQAPHPLFDPALCAATMTLPEGLAGRGDMPATTVLARYLALDAEASLTVRPHLFFDPGHYLRQAVVSADDAPLLIDFVLHGAAAGLSPHPLLRSGGPAACSCREALFAWLGGSAGTRGGAPSIHPLFDAAHFAGEDRVRLALAAPNPLWAHLIEGNRAGRGPHPLLLAEWIMRSHPDVLCDPIAAVDRMARGEMPLADPHPLVSARHILRQSPAITQRAVHPLTHFLERGVAENLDPHPWFSTQFYLYTNPDVARARQNPLLHYLAHGQYEGRWPHPFFDGNQYYQKYLRGKGGGQPLVDYVNRGAGLFWNALGVDDRIQRLTLAAAEACLAGVPADDTGLAVAAGRSAPELAPAAVHAARLLLQALHPQTGVRHPDLVTDVRRLRTADPTGDMIDARLAAPACTVSVRRPAVVAPVHIAPVSGQYAIAEVTAAVYPGATLVAGNDGFLTRSGEWLDHGLAGFDPAAMDLKGNAAVAALAGGRVLLRRYEGGGDLAEGIFACGSYSRNYFHFLIETLPRALLAADAAPAGTPVLTDDDMPAQHYQALRLALPGNPVLRLARHRSYRVGRLHAAGMANVFHDAFRRPDVAPDALRLHPQLVRRIADLAAGLRSAAEGSPRRLFLRRQSQWRRLLNGAEIEAALVARGFTAVDLASVDFAGQMRLAANAEAIVGQSGAQLANIVFARPGTRVFPLYSNAPGSNYYLWSELGAPLGLDVVNIAGWRVPGTTGGAAPEAHEHFTVAPERITAFFPSAALPAAARAVFDALHAAGAEAEALSGAWSVRAGATPAGFEARLAALRRCALDALERASAADCAALIDHPFFTDPWASLKSGLVALRDHDAAEAATLERISAHLAGLRTPDGDASQADEGDGLRRAIMQAALLAPAWGLPLIDDLADLPVDVVPLYLRWLTAQPFLFRAGDDEGYVAYCAALLDWFDRHLAPGRPVPLRRQVARTAGELDLGQLLLIEAPLGPVFAARNRVLERIAVGHGRARERPRPADGSAGRRRVGILCRTFDKGPDSEAVVAMFRAFDRNAWEVFAYSIGHSDRVSVIDADFDRDFDAAIDHRRLLSQEASALRAQILADDLDAFLFANATTYGLRALDRALYYRVAPVQAVMNSHLPMPMGYPSFDAFITGLSDHADHDVVQADYRERLIRRAGPVISYLTSLKPRGNPPLDRAALGLGADDIVMMNAGSNQKLRRDCLLTMMRTVAAVPGAILLLAPYNPGWAARSQAFAFNRQLAETAAEVGLEPARIRVLSELSVAEAEAALSCADIYLNPFPHGGATMTHLALIYGVPPVTLRRRSTRSIDQFLIRSLGLERLLADTVEDYQAIAAALAHDPAGLRAMAADMRKAARHPVFVDNPAYSRDIQASIAELLAKPGASVTEGAIAANGEIGAPGRKRRREGAE